MSTPDRLGPGGLARLRRTGARLAALAVGLTVVWLTVLAFGARSDVDLTIVLLVVMVEVLAIGVVTGPVLAVCAALAAVVMVNWELVPPYHTFEIDNPENVTALVTFALVAIAGAALVEIGARARTRAEHSQQRAQLLGDVVAIQDKDDLLDPTLEPVRLALALDLVTLFGPGVDGPATLLQRAGTTRAEGAEPTVDITLPGGYRLVGHGQPRLAADPAFLATVGAAAVRSYEGARMEAERRRAEELAAVDHARTALLASVGHDLRTPLAGLRVAVDALCQPESQLSAQDRTELLETISGSAERLDELITNLLDLSRLEAGALITQPERTDVGEIVARTVLTCAQPDRVDVVLDEPLPDVLVDPTLLERVVANLVSNALRHTASSSGVQLTAQARGGAVDLMVVDHGPGIPAAARAEVFRPFRQLSGAADGGSGLGLAVVDGFTRAMGLAVRLSDTPGGGLTATLSIPLARPT